MRDEIVARIRPDLPRPRCRVKLVCGPPAAGKTTYVEAYKAPGDIVIDLDAIAAEFGFDRNRPPEVVGELLEIRNERLAALAKEPPERVAWVVMTAPSKRLRQWWCDVLGVFPQDLVLIVPPLSELRKRILADPERKKMYDQQAKWVAEWFKNERYDDPRHYLPGVDINGIPLDPLHFNR